ncbi:unnamed protein product [Durusdinium trenchii]|uniref:Dihydrolipoyl dehydrogenase n=1 Tax=Durusdinium trenchii TaxID=1381693 RepID=A0ABP0HG49_9DINO
MALRVLIGYLCLWRVTSLGPSICGSKPDAVPGCDKRDMGSCGNACCVVEVALPLTSEQAYQSTKDALQRLGEDGFEYVTGGSPNPADDLRPYNISSPKKFQFILQGRHNAPKYFGANGDILNFAIYEGDAPTSSVLRMFSLSRIHGALGDNGQNYKTLSLLAKRLKAAKRVKYGCHAAILSFVPRGQADLRVVTYLKGYGKLTGPNSVSVAMNDGSEQTITAKNIMLATGSEIIEKLPFVEVDEEQIVSSTGALDLKQVPEKLVVIGGGVIGLELGSVYERLGSKVTVVEFLPTIGGIGIDGEVSKEMQKILKKQGINFMMSTKVTAVEKTGGLVKVGEANCASRTKKAKDANVVLVCVGRREFRDGLGAEEVGVELDGRKIKVDDTFKTSVPSIYAIGDIIHGPMLAHKAEDEGAMVAEYLATGKHPHLDYNNVPSVLYTHPEVAWVGKSEEMLKQEGVEYRKGKFAFAANGRSIANMDTDGFVKVLSCKKTDKLLGVHIINAIAGDIISGACIGIEYGAASEDLARVCMAHPTVSEVLKGAAQKTAFGKAVSG